MRSLSLAEYGVGARIVGLPGHTRGSIGVAAEGWLITGDALTHLFRRPGKAVLYGDEGTMLESVKKVTALGDITLCFGHGAPEANREW